MRDVFTHSPQHGSFLRPASLAGKRDCGISLFAKNYRGVPLPFGWNRNQRPKGEKEGKNGRKRRKGQQ